MENPRVDAEFVLEHQSYVKRLARGLVFDEAQADDLAQQVWLAALEHPPAHGHALRGWLATIARNLASLSRRGAARRELREHSAARDESVAAADELVLRENLRASLVQAVLALDEPFREAIILRYFDELAPRAIAAKQGVPIATVKSRLKRGLADLRSRMDREGGGRAAWCLAFVQKLRIEPSSASLAAFSAKSLAGGVLLMTASQKIVIAAAVIVAALIGWRVVSPNMESGAAVSLEAPAAEAPALVASAETAQVETRKPVKTVSESLAPFFGRQKPRAKKTGPGDLDVTVLTMPGRVPLADVTVQVSPDYLFESRDRTITARTNSLGVAHFEQLAEGNVGISCDRASEGGGLPLAFGLVRPGELCTATILIENPCGIRGRVLDESGQPVEGAEIRLAQHSDEIVSFRVASSAVDGRFEIHGVKAKSVYVFAMKPGHAPSKRHFNFTNEGADLEVELVLRGPAGALDGFVRDGGGAPIANALVIAGPRGATVWVDTQGRIQMGADGAAVRTNESGQFEFNGIFAGASEIYVHARECVDTIEMLEIVAGQTAHHDILLARGALLAGIVKGSDGKPARSGTVMVRESKSGATQTAQIDELGAYRLGGLEPGSAHVSASDNQRIESLEAELVLSPSGETNWSPQLSSGIEIVGRVLDENEKPVNRANVYLRRDAAGEEPFARAERTDREGRFRVKGCRDTEYVLDVYPEKSTLFSIAQVRGVRPSGNELVVRLDPKLRPSAYIKGRVVDPDGRALGGIKLTPFAVEGDYHATELTKADGTFKAGPFPAGPWGMDINAPGLAPFAMGKRELTAKQTLDLGTIQLARGDVIDVHLVYPSEPHSTQLGVVVSGLDSELEEWCKVEGDHARTPPLPPGRYRISFTGAYAACNLDAEVVSGRETKHELLLKPGIAFKVRADDQRKGEPTRVVLRLRDGAGEQLMERTPRIDQLKTYQLPVCLAPGHYRLEATDPAGRAWSHEFEVDAATAQQVIAIELH